MFRADGFKVHLIFRPLCSTGGPIFPDFFEAFEAGERAQKNPAEVGAPPGHFKYVKLFWNYIGSLRTFFPLGLFKLDLLALF